MPSLGTKSTLSPSNYSLSSIALYFSLVPWLVVRCVVCCILRLTFSIVLLASGGNLLPRVRRMAAKVRINEILLCY